VRNLDGEIGTTIFVVHQLNAYIVFSQNSSLSLDAMTAGYRSPDVRGAIKMFVMRDIIIIQKHLFLLNPLGV
jgi:hypothetical protein